jgi:hypothetical protein
MKPKTKPFIPLLLFIAPVFSGSCEGVKDQAVVWVQFDVSAVHEEYFRAGDPEVTVNITTNIDFTHYGFYTVNRISSGSGFHYLAFPGMDGSPRVPQVMNLVVWQSHPCMDGEGFIIGRESRTIPASVNTATVGLVVEPVGRDRISIQFSPVLIEASMHDCSNPQCLNGFGFGYGDDVVGWDRSVLMEDEYGYEESLGYELVEMEYKLLTEIAAGSGEMALVMPVSINRTFEMEEDTPTGPVRRVYTFRIDGHIGPAPTDP